jgi:hypothetical protein
VHDSLYHRRVFVRCHHVNCSRSAIRFREAGKVRYTRPGCLDYSDRSETDLEAVGGVLIETDWPSGGEAVFVCEAVDCCDVDVADSWGWGVRDAVGAEGKEGHGDEVEIETHFETAEGKGKIRLSFENANCEWKIYIRKVLNLLKYCRSGV